MMELSTGRSRRRASAFTSTRSGWTEPSHAIGTMKERFVSCGAKGYSVRVGPLTPNDSSHADSAAISAGLTVISGDFFAPAIPVNSSARNNVRMRSVYDLEDRFAEARRL